MKNLRGGTALLTGASGGIGRRVASALAREGMNVVVSGRREDALDSAVRELQASGVNAAAIPADLGDAKQVESLLDRAEGTLGPVDVLVNNAGIESTAAFTRYTAEELISMVDVNLVAPILLTHQAVPRMLERGTGHVVFMASVAGKFGPAYSEPYAATKAALIGLTQSLRAEYLNSPVGFSVVCPGFVAGDGMYQRMEELGIRSNRAMGTTSLDKVADAVVDAIRRDRAEVIEAGRPFRPLLAVLALAPGLGARLAARAGATDLFRRVAAERDRI